jgi:hypothetical protein
LPLVCVMLSGSVILAPSFPSPISEFVRFAR